MADEEVQAPQKVVDISKWFSFYPINIDQTKSIDDGRSIAKVLCIENPNSFSMYRACKEGLQIDALEQEKKKKPRDQMREGRIKVENTRDVIIRQLKAFAEQKNANPSTTENPEKQAAFTKYFSNIETLTNSQLKTAILIAISELHNKYPRVTEDESSNDPKLLKKLAKQQAKKEAKKKEKTDKKSGGKKGKRK